MMKIFVFALLIAGSYGSYGSYGHSAPLYTPALPVASTLINTGASSQYRSQDNIGNYAFGYNEDHSSGGTFRREQGDALGTKVGSYGLRDADGRIRIVNYIADSLGFRASIQTNEPGTEPRDPANVLINKAAVVATPAHLIAPAAPLAVAAAAPLAAYTPTGYAAPAVYSAPSYAAPLDATAAALNPAFAPYYAHGLALPYGNFGVRRR